ncbi:ATP synthase F0 subunit B [Mollicutes bacterium LVI A0039]|nr:ATP synthase F0 subunit B [Mollicutes bacterium LVI A0039]
MLNLGLLLDSLTMVHTDVSEFGINITPQLPTIIFQLVATIGLFLLIKKKAWPQLKQSILDRAEYVNKTLDDADNIKAESIATKQQYEAELNQVKNTKQEIFAQATREANLQKDKTITESKTRGREIIEKSIEEANLSKGMIEEQIQKEMMFYVNEVAAKFISEKISDEEELKMIEDAVAGLK